MKYFSLIIVFLLLTGCPFPDLNFWVGDSSKGAIVNSSGTIIECADPIFDRYGCLHKDDIIALKKWINHNCKDTD